MTLDADYLFVILVVATIGASGLVLLLVDRAPRAPRHPRPRMRNRLDGLAAALNLTPGILAIALAGLPALAAFLGVVWGLAPAVLAAFTVVGAATPPWLIAARLDTLRQRREEAVVAMARDLADRLAGTPLNQVVRSLGHRPPALLRTSVEVLGDIDRPLEDCLAECARRSGSALMNRLCVYILVGLKADAIAFRELLPTTILPHLDSLLRQQRARATALAYQRGVITIMGGALTALFAVLYGLGPAFREFYGTGEGALTILGLIVGFLLLVALVHRVLRTPRRPLWRIDILSRELAKY